MQNPKDRRQIILDDKLRTIFSGKITAFSMNSQLSRHFIREGGCFAWGWEGQCGVLGDVEEGQGATAGAEQAGIWPAIVISVCCVFGETSLH